MNTMDCTDTKVLLSGLVDDTIDHDTRYRAERHLAECAACRTLLEQAEAIDGLIAEDVMNLQPSRVPQGFEDAVLARTAFRERRRSGVERWTQWVGWLAAAAALALALTIWTSNRRGRSIGGETVPQMTRRYDVGPELRSFVNETNDVRATTASTRAILDPIPVEYAARRPVSSAHADTLHAVALVLDMLLDPDSDEPENLELIRRVIDYDELQPRLLDVSRAIDERDRPGVAAAESMLFRLVNGPTGSEDMQLLRGAVRQLGLPRLLERIADRQEPRSL